MGATVMLASGLGFGMSGVFTRSIEGGAWEIASWRGLTATPVIVAYVWWRRRRDAEHFRIRLDPASAAKALVLLALNAAAMVLLVTSIQKTAVANVSVIMATIPFMAAGLGWLILREGLRRSTVIAAAVSFGGLVLTVAGSLGAGNLEGDLLAVALSLTLASLIVLIRRFPGTDALLAQAGSGVALFPVALVVADPLGMAASEMPLTVAFGLVFAVSLILWTEGVRRLRAAEAALLATTETPCSILAAWIVVSEAPPLLTVVGGLLIVGAVITHARADLVHDRVSRPWQRHRTRPKI
ncbi:MAG: DMT family transporter [Acidimicrobiia bacterium]|nr:DMT family transporter [Acidimicrobiia bacterium]